MMAHDVATLYPQLQAIEALPRPLRIAAVSHVQRAIDDLDALLRQQCLPPVRAGLRDKQHETT